MNEDRLHKLVAEGLIASYFDPWLRDLVFFLTEKGKQRAISNGGQFKFPST